MTLIEGFAKDEIFIDFGAEVMYGDDQAYISYPCRFPTVGFQLMATNGLVQIADRIRKDKGMKPMHPMDEYTDDTCDNEGWYDFYKKLDLIITKSISRFSRNTLVALATIKKLKAKKVGIYFESEGVYSLNEDNRMGLTFFCEIAEQESRIRSRSMETSLRMRLDHGLPLTPELLGFVKD